MNQQQVRLSEALAFAEGKTVHSEVGYQTPSWGEVPGIHEIVGWSPDDFSVVRFSDGTAVAVLSSHRGPYSKQTPDVDVTANIYIIGDWPA